MDENGSMVACVVCGRHTYDQVADAAAVEAQERFLREFHHRRTKPAVDASNQQERSQFTQSDAVPIWRCCSCGTLSRGCAAAEPKDNVDKYAADTYGEQKLRALYQSQCVWFADKMAILRPVLKPGAIVWEVGSFVGGFLHQCRVDGIMATGIDPGQEVSEFARRQGLRTITDLPENVPVPPSSVDVVAIWNTFDQIADPHPTLEWCARCLRPGGRLLVRVPNGHAYSASVGYLHRKYGAPRTMRSALLRWMAWNNLLTFPYLHGYTVDSLRTLMGQYGFDAVQVRGDTLIPISDDTTRRWAALEEWAFKNAWRPATSLFSDSWQRAWAPWLDFVFVKR